jgi:catecholate siderophore receptor
MLAKPSRRASARGPRVFSLSTSLTPIAAAVLFACMAGNALADDVTAATAAKGETTLQEVKVKSSRERADGPVDGYRATRSSTVTRTDTPLRDVPQSVQVIPEALMKDQAMQSMAQVIRYVPGASMNPGEGGRDQPVLRGISTNSDFYVDGLRDDALYFRDPYNAERIEILKGPSGMTFGRGGAGGVINRVTKRPLDTPRRELGLTLGTENAKRATVDISGRLGAGAGQAGYRVNAMVEDSGGFRDGFELRRSGINPVFEFFPSDATSVLVGYEHFEDRRTIDRGIPSQGSAPYETARETFFGNAGQSEGSGRVDALTARIEHQLGANLTLRNNLRVTDSSTFRQNVQPATAVNSSGNLQISAYNSANERTNVFNQTEAEARLTMGGMEHLVLAGVEFGRQRSDSTRITGYFNGVERAVVSAQSPLATVTEWRTKASDGNNLVTANVAAAYVQDQITLTPQWKAVAGVRYDRFKVDFDDRRAVPLDLARTDAEFSPRVGVIYQPTASQSYYASYSYAFLPSAENLSLAANTAELEPEKAKNWEFGAKWDLTPGLSATAAIFRLDRANVKATDPNDSTRLQLTGLQRTEGFELGIQGQLTERWQVYAGFAKLDAEIKQATTVPAGTKVALVPRQAASLWNRIDLAAGWSAGLGIVHQSDVYASSTNLVRLPSYTRVDGAVFYQVDKNTRIALNLENLTDRRYYATAGGDNNIIPGAPRSAKVSLSKGF